MFRAWEKYGRWIEPILVVLGIQAVHFLNTRVAVATAPNLAVARPIKGLAAWLFISWDAEHYLRLATNYDSYAWPPLYPMTLRLISALGFEVQVSAILLNLLAHLAIVYLAYAYVRGNPKLSEVPGCSSPRSCCSSRGTTSSSRRTRSRCSSLWPSVRAWRTNVSDSGSPACSAVSRC